MRTENKTIRQMEEAWMGIQKGRKGKVDLNISMSYREKRTGERTGNIMEGQEGKGKTEGTKKGTGLKESVQRDIFCQNNVATYDC